MNQSKVHLTLKRHQYDQAQPPCPFISPSNYPKMKLIGKKSLMIMRTDYSPSNSCHNKPREHANGSIPVTFLLTSSGNGLSLVFENLIEIVVYSLAVLEKIVRIDKKNCTMGISAYIAYFTKKNKKQKCLHLSI